MAADAESSSLSAVCGTGCCCNAVEEVYGNQRGLERPAPEIPSPPPPPFLFRGAGAAIGQQDDPPPPPHQFAVWVAQREGQRSNKCRDLEVLSHGNVIPHMSASLQEQRQTKTCCGGQTGVNLR